MKVGFVRRRRCCGDAVVHGRRVGAAADRHQVQPRRRRSTRRRARAPNTSRSSPRSAPRAASRSRSIRTARSSRTARRWRRCSSARCRCWRPRSRSSARSACANSRCSTCRTSSTTTTSCTRSRTGPVGAALFKKLEAKGIVGLAYWDNGFKVMSANKPIRMPADYKGLKMRIQSSKVLGDEMKALGAIPQVMAFSEVYQALQTGVVDGTENPPSNFYTQKMQEVQKYLALTDHGVSRLRGDRQQEVLGRPAGRHPHDARRRDEGRDQIRERHRARRRTTTRWRRSRQVRQDPDPRRSRPSRRRR